MTILIRLSICLSAVIAMLTISACAANGPKTDNYLIENPDELRGAVYERRPAYVTPHAAPAWARVRVPENLKMENPRLQFVYLMPSGDWTGSSSPALHEVKVDPSKREWNIFLPDYLSRQGGVDCRYIDDNQLSLEEGQFSPAILNAKVKQYEISFEKFYPKAELKIEFPYGFFNQVSTGYLSILAMEGKAVPDRVWMPRFTIPEEYSKFRKEFLVPAGVELSLVLRGKTQKQGKLQSRDGLYPIGVLKAGEKRKEKFDPEKMPLLGEYDLPRYANNRWPYPIKHDRKAE